MKREWIINPVIFFLMLVLSGVLMIGCGEAKKETGDAGRTVPTQQAATVGLDVCTNCHFGQTQMWVNSRHGNMDNPASLDANGSPSYIDFADSSCAACHDQLGDGQRLTAGLTGNSTRPVVGCESCHGGGGQHFGTGPISMTRLQADANYSGQFRTCTDCHQLLDSAGTGTASPLHADAGRRITDTHFATPGSWTGVGGVNVNDITGYAMNSRSETVCSNCHNAHTTNLDNNIDWAASGHADKTAAGAWAHYNWSQSSRTQCQRCHTTSGFSALADSAINGTVYSPPLSVNNSFKPEMLECNGCHTSVYGGKLRNPGKFVVHTNTTYVGTGYVFPAGRSIPNIFGSYICVNCHSGTETGEYIKSAPTISGSNFGTFNSHYFAAGGILFRTIGYEYSGQTYSNYTFFRHDKIGTADAAGTGTNGPCVECHMGQPDSHLFLPLTRSAVTGSVTSIDNPLCATCHGGALTPAILNEQEEGYENALVALEAAMEGLTTPIYYCQDSYPYFFKTAACPGAFADAFTAWPNADTLGAAFNLNMLKHMGMAVVHNRRYTKLLIFDSIDFIDNGTIDGTINLSAYPVAAEWYQEDGNTANDNAVARPPYF